MSSRTLPGTLLLMLMVTLMLVGPRAATAAIRMVASCADSGATTLRGQVAAALAGDTLLLPTCTITLNSPVTITKSLTLSGEGAAVTAISGGGVTRVLVVNSGTVVTISGVTIRDGSGISSGAGVNNQGTLTLSECVVTANTASNTTGGGIANTGTLTLLNTTVSGNTAIASSFGGGLYNGGTLTLLNSTVSGNHSNVNGGGLLNAGTLTLLNSTVSGNAATSGQGGGLNVGAAVATAKNTLIAGNSAPTGANCFGTPISSQGHNLDRDGSCGFGSSGDLSGVDPKLGLLQNNGGPTPTHALLPGSPAIDAGDNAGCPPTDQRGVPRPLDALTAGVVVCDIGAFEVETLGFIQAALSLNLNPS